MSRYREKVTEKKKKEETGKFLVSIWPINQYTVFW
jgi:hypothetical protein